MIYIIEHFVSNALCNSSSAVGTLTVAVKDERKGRHSNHTSCNTL